MIVSLSGVDIRTGIVGRPGQRRARQHHRTEYGGAEQADKGENPGQQMRPRRLHARQHAVTAFMAAPERR